MDIQIPGDAIKARLDELWTFPSVPVTKLGEPFTPPEPPSPWVLIDIEWTGGEGMSIGSPGSNRKRRKGNINFIAMVPSWTGFGVADYYAGQAAALFESVDFSGIVCETAEPRGDVTAESGDWRGRLVTVPFHYDEFA